MFDSTETPPVFNMRIGPAESTAGNRRDVPIT